MPNIFPRMAKNLLGGASHACAPPWLRPWWYCMLWCVAIWVFTFFSSELWNDCSNQSLFGWVGWILWRLFFHPRFRFADVEREAAFFLACAVTFPTETIMQELISTCWRLFSWWQRHRSSGRAV